MSTYHSKSNASKLFTLLLITIMLAFCAGLTGCGGEDEITDDDIDYHMNEGGSEGAPPVDPKKVAKSKELNKESSNFIGTWAATSDEAKNLYGHLQITINDDGTFDADVTDEIFSGTWTKTDNGITYSSDLMKGKIYYGEYGKLVIQDVENGDVRVVLNRVN